MLLNFYLEIVIHIYIHYNRNVKRTAFIFCVIINAFTATFDTPLLNKRINLMTQIF